MNTEFHIRFLKRQQIDTARWDACITQSNNRLIYAFHPYLDTMTDGRWDALIWEDYRAVMPLTWRRKYGITYLAQPPFTQQTGIFAPETPSIGLILAFLRAASSRYPFVEIFLNYANPAAGLEPRNNFILPLDKPYELLAAAYTHHLRRILRRVPTLPLQYTPDVPLDHALQAYEQLYRHRIRNAKNRDFRNFAALCYQYRKKEQLILRAVKDSQSQWLAIAVLLRDAHRLYLLQSTALPAGRERGANHFLVDRLIHEFSGQPMILDFEGSEHPGVARFYAAFGSILQPYFFYRSNTLPWPVRLLKPPTRMTNG
ncbi:MAG TPA: hypothetical protein VHE34_06750 [Puia sp.]|uniref:hypothetical protein n=1 Tax=Puia sp. TaxID=2045100 RepID=UPI002B6C01DB|nr:hypothetical protein [Puia sp.]HVU94905.1 hypothetical protein [Puia sp.]